MQRIGRHQATSHPPDRYNSFTSMQIHGGAATETGDRIKQLSSVSCTIGNVSYSVGRQATRTVAWRGYKAHRRGQTESEKKERKKENCKFNIEQVGYIQTTTTPIMKQLSYLYTL